MSSQSSPTASLADYGIDYNTTQTVAIGDDDPQLAYVKGIHVRVLKYGDELGEPPVEVGQATGAIVLGELASQEGSSLSEVCDEHSRDLDVLRTLIDKFADGINDDENLLYVADIVLNPEDDTPELRTALFQDILRFAGVRFRFAVTFCDAFGVPRDSGPLDPDDERIPEGTIFVTHEDVVIWERGRRGWFTYCEDGFPENEDGEPGAGGPWRLSVER